MDFITILTIILLSENGKDYGIQVPYPSAEMCEEALPAVSDALAVGFPDLVAKCVETGIISHSPIPPVNPRREQA